MVQELRNQQKQTERDIYIYIYRSRGTGAVPQPGNILGFDLPEQDGICDIVLRIVLMQRYLVHSKLIFAQ